MRYCACVEYDGARFHGWQRQTGARTVQGVLEAAFSQIADQPVTVVAAGRTDAGVHACGQVIHFETGAVRRPYAWIRGANTLAGGGVSVQWVRQAASDFHARFSATGRSYRYVILNRWTPPTYLAGRVTWDYRGLDVGRMRDGARHLLGRHDFSAFRSAACQSGTPVKDVRRVDIGIDREWIWIDVEADGFLHHMVRNFAGALLSVGAGERNAQWIAGVLESRDRTQAAETAPPYGLYLTEVVYPARFGLPAPPAPCRFW